MYYPFILALTQNKFMEVFIKNKAKYCCGNKIGEIEM